MRIYVPRPGEIVPAGSAGAPAESKVNLNTATATELDAGYGEVQFREQHACALTPTTPSR
jgi:DNA uptake protein ComE-like DNA-binding protein